MACVSNSGGRRVNFRFCFAGARVSTSRTSASNRLLVVRSQPPEDDIYNKPEFQFDASSEVPGENDMWEGEQWELVGKAVALLIPVLLVGGAVVGSFAANTYNQGADSYLVSPSQERPAQIIKGSDYGL